MVKLRFFAVLLFSLTPVVAHAQTERPTSRVNTEDALRVAEQHFRKGESCIRSSSLDCARREFDQAIDSILELGIDIRSDKRLLAGYRELIEKINRFETSPSALNADGIWGTQDYEGRPARASAEIAEAEQEYLTDGPLTAAEFQRRFAELRRSFREKYDSDITLTGADHGEHRRLYGPGSAYDIRVRDLTREQVGFIIRAGNRLGLRIKDFSTWDKVAAHNARTLSLGRPLDTLATGIHLHIDRMGPPKKRQLISTPAISSKQTKAKAPKGN